MGRIESVKIDFLTHSGKDPPPVSYIEKQLSQALGFQLTHPDEVLSLKEYAVYG